MLWQLRDMQQRRGEVRLAGRLNDGAPKFIFCALRDGYGVEEGVGVAPIAERRQGQAAKAWAADERHEADQRARCITRHRQLGGIRTTCTPVTMAKGGEQHGSFCENICFACACRKSAPFRDQCGVHRITTGPADGDGQCRGDGADSDGGSGVGGADRARGITGWITIHHPPLFHVCGVVGQVLVAHPASYSE